MLSGKSSRVPRFLSFPQILTPQRYGDPPPPPRPRLVPTPISFRTGNRSVLLPTFSEKGNHFLQTAISDPPLTAWSGSANLHDSSVITQHTPVGQESPQPGSQPNPQNLP